MEYRLTAPMTREQARQLRCGDTVLFTGTIYTARDAAHKRLVELLDRGELDGEIFRYSHQFAAADRIVIAAPYWDLSFPAQLKIYIENIYATGIVTRYGADGRPEGMCRAEELIYVTTSGGPFDGRFGYGYVKALAEDYFGIPATRLLLAEGLDIRGNDPEAILQKVMAENGLTEA